MLLSKFSAQAVWNPSHVDRVYVALNSYKVKRSPEKVSPTTIERTNAEPKLQDQQHPNHHVNSMSSPQENQASIATMSDDELIVMNNTLSQVLDSTDDLDDMEILSNTNGQYEVKARGKHLSIIFESPAEIETERPDSSHLTRPGSIHGPLNPLGSHPVTPPATPSTEHGDDESIISMITVYPTSRASTPLPSPRPPPGPYSLFPRVKQVRFHLTPTQHRASSTQHAHLVESRVLPSEHDASDEDESSHANTVRFQLTGEQYARLETEHPKLKESECVAVRDLKMNKVRLVKSIVKHVLGRKGKGKGEGVVKVTVTEE